MTGALDPPPLGSDERGAAETAADAGAAAAAAAPEPPLKLEPTRGAAALRRQLLFVAVAGLVLGIAAVRQGMLLRARIDLDLVTTPDAALVDTIAIAARIVLVLLVAALVLRARPWLRGVRHNLRLLSERGFVGTTVAAADGSVRHVPDPESPWLLLAPVPRTHVD